MRYVLTVGHAYAGGGGTLCAEPFTISPDEFAAIRANVFGWMDGLDMGLGLNALRPNWITVTDPAFGVLFSASRS